MKQSAKLDAIINGQPVKLDIARDGERLTATVDDRRYELALTLQDDGTYLVTHNHKVYECFAGKSAGSGEVATIFIGNRAYDVTVTDPKRLGTKSGAAGANVARGQAVIRAPMPGRIVRVMVEAGEAVAAGDGLIIVEAMKMQNELKAPKAGIVLSINAENGATVGAGDVLVTID
ncbi:MAG: biotin/lipoyl-binding protein [Pyrinomonadaceae bacterium MAG19_C2-C3]|nr:biotin/lipoyl-binding protein [Pyrinomonadaceae bacterium MAG19_C2-C3]